MGEIQEKGTALRYDEGKILHELLPAHALNELAKVYTFGAKKYEPNNWRKGMQWSRIIASLKRHLNYIERGIDYDDESTLLHASHVVWNAVTLLEYYKIYPQGDDRYHNYLSQMKIGLDIDEVLADFTKGWGKLHGITERPTSWNYHRDMGKELQKMKDKGVLDEFYLSLEPKIKAEDLPFEPYCYVTSRPIDSKITEKWLEMHNFPGTKVITVPVGESKVQALKDLKVDIFVDDGFHNFVELNKNGICCYLLSAPHNLRYDVGYKRINSLKELIM